MRPVRQNDKTGANGAGARWGVGVLALALRASGCAGTGSASAPRTGGVAAGPRPAGRAPGGPRPPPRRLRGPAGPAPGPARAGRGYAVARPEDYL